LSEIMTELEALVDGIGQLAMGHASGADEHPPGNLVAAPSQAPPGTGQR
jgi:hypothetical protein